MTPEHISKGRGRPLENAQRRRWIDEMNDGSTAVPWGEAKLSVVRALVGEISPFMRAVSVQNAPGILKVWVYTERDATPDEQEDFDACVMTQVVSDFPDEFASGEMEIGFEFVSVSCSARVNAEGQLVFMRKEETIQP